MIYLIITLTNKKEKKKTEGKQKKTVKIDMFQNLKGM